MRLGELLIMNGFLSQEQLDQALAQQKQTPKKIGEVLIEQGFITERQLVEALEFQLGVPVMNMNETVLDRETVELVSETIARKYGLVPIDRKGGKLRVVMLDPLNSEAIMEVQKETGMTVQPVLATHTDIQQVINDCYGVEESAQEVNAILESAVQQNATVIHIDPLDYGLIVKYRINNQLKTQKTIPKNLKASIIERIKLVSNLRTNEKLLPQDGRMQVEINSKTLDIRVSVLPNVNGESITLRLVDMSESISKLEDLGMSESNLLKLQEVIEKRKGTILFSGPPHSGKTSTLYSVIQSLNKEDAKIVAVEDPVERRIPGIVQVDVNERNGLTFPYALQTVLRQDPNAVIIGDIHDLKTAEMAGRASVSGIFVLGAIHEENAVKAIRRLMDMAMDRYLIAASLSCVVAQRMVRRICRHCTQSVPASEEELKLLDYHGLLQSEDQNKGSKGMMGNFRSFVSSHISGKITLTKGNGCSICGNTGYRGYAAIHEVLLLDDKLREMIYQDRPVQELEKHLDETGHRTLLYDGLLKAREGVTSVEEVLKAIN